MKCPTCREDIKKNATLCRWCRSEVPPRPTHGGVCPRCCETVKNRARKCRYCWSWIGPEPEPVAPMERVQLQFVAAPSPEPETPEIPEIPIEWGPCHHGVQAGVGYNEATGERIYQLRTCNHERLRRAAC